MKVVSIIWPWLISLIFSLTPPSVSMNCSSGKVTFVRKQFVRLVSPSDSDVIEVHESPPPSGCYRACQGDDHCTAYVIDYRNESCLLLRSDPDALEQQMIEDEASSYYRKVCLPGYQCDQQWAFDVISGVQLYRYYDKIIYNVTRDVHCMALCITESTFICRSARFDEVKLMCVVSRHDRRTASEVFRQSEGHVTYLERQCIKEPSSCTFRPRKSRAMVHQHVQLASDVASRSQCEMACLSHSQFTCRSYQFDEEVSVCLLSPEDSHTFNIGPGQGRGSSLSSNGSLFEKESCIEVDVRCESTAMTAVVRVSTPFRGRVYAVGHPYDCYSVSVSDSGHVALSMPLHGRKCATRNLGNGTFMNSVVVQHHPFVLRTSDRRIDVACDYEEMMVKIRGSKDVKEGELKPLSHTVTAIAPTPPIRLRVVNASDQDVSGVELGDPLFLKVELSDESVYGIFGSGLVARSSGGSETVLLIDDNGCPVEPSVISSLERLPGSKSLVAPFQAFKFASDTAVKFQLTVSYCLDSCPPVNCQVTSRTESQRSYGRKKRATGQSSKMLEVQPGDVITDVTMESAMFLVTNLKPTQEKEEPGQEWQQQELKFVEPEGDIRIRAPLRGFCISMSTLYIAATIAGAVQLAIVCECAILLFGRKNNKHPNVPCGGSRDSISSKSKLCSRA